MGYEWDDIPWGRHTKRMVENHEFPVWNMISIFLGVFQMSVNVLTINKGLRKIKGCRKTYPSIPKASTTQGVDEIVLYP